LGGSHPRGKKMKAITKAGEKWIAT